MLKKTPLNAAHHALAARMVDFGGWEMPVNYGSQIEEHHAVRNDAGMFDVSHMCAVKLTGPDVHAFLRRLLANDVEKLKGKPAGKALYSPMCNEQGGVVDDLIAYRFADSFYRMVVNAGTAEKDLGWMRKKQAEWGMDLAIEALNEGAKAVAMVAVQGPNARRAVWQALPETQAATEKLPPFFGVDFGLDEGRPFIATTGYTGEDGFEITVPASGAEKLWNALKAAGARPCGLGARDTLRLEAGMNLYGQDMDEATSPLDAGLAWCTDLSGGRDFVGKAALLANGQKHAFLGLLLADRKAGVLRAHQKVQTPLGEGEITSGSFSPTLGRPIALARLPLGVEAGQSVQVDIRGKWADAQVAKPPFARDGKARV
jgi:aminomethyltransferase